MSDDKIGTTPEDIIPAQEDTLELPVEQVQQLQEQVQQNVQNNASNIDIGSVVDGVTDYLVIDSIVDGVAAIGEGLVSIIGSMFE